MIHKFSILKHIPASRSNVIANYLDLEHIPVHSGLHSARVISETRRAACFVLTSRVGFIPIKNVHYFEFRPPDQILQMVKTPLGPMRVLATATEFKSGTADVYCDVDVAVEIDLPKFLYPFRIPIEWVLKRLNETVLREDLEILERRQRILGDFVGDYLRRQQHILFKDVFREYYGRRETPPAQASEAEES